MRLACPCCGPRDLAEFSYGGDAGALRPDPGETDGEAFAAWILDRANPRGPHAELWQHVGGCRHWLRVVRDTATHAVLSVEPAGRAALFMGALSARKGRQVR